MECNFRNDSVEISAPIENRYVISPPAYKYIRYKYKLLNSSAVSDSHNNAVANIVQPLCLTYDYTTGVNNR